MIIKRILDIMHRIQLTRFATIDIIIDKNTRMNKNQQKSIFIKSYRQSCQYKR